MPDAADFAALFTSLKAVTDLTKFFIDAHDAGVVRTKAIELQREIIATQQGAIAANLAHTATLHRIGELEKEVADLKAWDAEKEKYQLVPVKLVSPGQHAPLAYAPKEQTAEPLHLLCPTCFEDRIKSILQTETRSPPLAEVLVCFPMRYRYLRDGTPLFSTSVAAEIATHALGKWEQLPGFKSQTAHHFSSQCKQFRAGARLVENVSCNRKPQRHA